MFTEDAASHYGVDEKLISAIISVESGGNPGVVSRSKAVGLMQIKASTADRVDYRVWRGKVNVIIGENGAGKSTLMKILAGVQQPTSGELFRNGEKWC